MEITAKKLESKNLIMAAIPLFTLLFDIAVCINNS
jgi:hypothetical protein